MDSTACGIFVGQAKRLRRDGSELFLVSQGSRVSRVLEIAGIDQVIHVYPTLHTAFRTLLLEPVT